MWSFWEKKRKMRMVWQKSVGMMRSWYISHYLMVKMRWVVPYLYPTSYTYPYLDPAIDPNLEGESSPMKLPKLLRRKPSTHKCIISIPFLVSPIKEKFLDLEGLGRNVGHPNQVLLASGMDVYPWEYHWYPFESLKIHKKVIKRFGNIFDFYDSSPSLLGRF